jgi:hypothetical protein
LKSIKVGLMTDGDQRDSACRRGAHDDFLIERHQILIEPPPRGVRTSGMGNGPPATNALNPVMAAILRPPSAYAPPQATAIPGAESDRSAGALMSRITAPVGR